MSLSVGTLMARFDGDASGYLRTSRRVRQDAKQTERDLHITGEIDADTRPLAKSMARARHEVGRATEDVAKRANFQFKTLATVIATSLPAAASAASAGMVAAGGAGFVALGAIALRESERVQDAWSELGTDLSGGLARDASVLEQAFVDAASNIGDAFEGLRPQMRQAFAASVPYVDNLTDSVTRFAHNAMPGAVAAARNAGPVFDGLEETAARVGSGISALMMEMAMHSESVGEGVAQLGSLVESVLAGIAPILGDLSDLWAQHGAQVVAAVSQALDVLGSLSGSALPAVSGAVGGVLTALGALLDALEPLMPIVGPLAGAWLSLVAAMRTIRGVGSIVGAATDRVTEFGGSLKTAEGRARALRAAGGALAVALSTLMVNTRDLNPQIDAMGRGLEEFARTGRLTGEVSRVLGGDMAELNYAINAVNSNGFDKAITGVAESVTGLVGYAPFDEARQRIDAIDGALAQMVRSGNADTARQALERLAREAGVSLAEMTRALPRYSGALETAGQSSDAFAGQSGKLNEAVARSSRELEEATTKLEQYINEQRAAVDPVFALRQAVMDVGQAQRDYNAAVAQHTENSPQARDAAWSLAEAVSAAEQAALDGNLSFSDFQGKLAAWAEQGVIDRDIADMLAGSVDYLRGRAEDYRGDYGAKFHADTRRAADNLAGVQGQLNALDGRVATSYHNLVRNVITNQGGMSGLYNFNWNARGAIWEDGVPTGFADGGVMDANRAAIAAPNRPRAVIPFIGDRTHDREFYIPDNDQPRSLAILQEANRSMLGAPHPMGMHTGGTLGNGQAAATDFVGAGADQVVSAIDRQTRELAHALRRAANAGAPITIKVDSRDLAHVVKRGALLNSRR